LALRGRPVTDVLYERLDEAQVAEVRTRVATAPELVGLHGIAGDEGSQRELTLQYGAWLGVPELLARTGLVAHRTPDHIHAMVHGPLAGAGGLYEADLIVSALQSAGVSVAAARAALDFGCSSGRILRVLQAAYPEVHWRGCDPNEPAIAWASEHLPAIDFAVSPQHPPLALGDGELDLAYAISIWSHFAPGLGLGWFEEMHRVLGSGGHLVFTTHGMHSVAAHVESGLRSPAQAREILDSLYRRGAWYAPEFGSSGDDGVSDPEWGTVYLTPEWVATKLCPAWRVLEYAPGANQRNQDVYVLERA
jgi:SAM-dependent methyltransferase